jgi:hypothetical protein
MIRLASATISSVRLFSRLEGLSPSARFEPAGKTDALQPFPTGLTSIRNPLYSMVVIILRDVALPSLTFLVLRGSRCGASSCALAAPCPLTSPDERKISRGAHRQMLTRKRICRPQLTVAVIAATFRRRWSGCPRNGGRSGDRLQRDPSGR